MPPLPARPPLPQSNQSAPVAQPPPSPLTLDGVIQLIKKSKSDSQSVASAIATRSVDFELDEKAEKKLRKAGADDELLADIWKVTPGGKANVRALLTSPTGTDVQASAGEAMALQEIQNEGAPDRRLRMVDAFEKKFPNSPLLSYVYTEAAKAQQQNGAFDEAIQYCRKSLKLDPDNTFSLIVMALVLPQPKLKGSANEVAGRLSEAAADANRALTLLEKLLKRPKRLTSNSRRGKDPSPRRHTSHWVWRKCSKINSTKPWQSTKPPFPRPASRPSNITIAWRRPTPARGMSRRPSQVSRKHQNWAVAHRCRNTPTTSSRNYSKKPIEGG